MISRAMPQPEVEVKQHKKRWYKWLLSPLWLCLLVAILVRVLLIFHTRGTFDGDEALVGIQAQHILQGEFPIYFYGIPYLGSLEAYLLAIVFAIAGSSAWALRAEPTLLSLVIVWLTWKLATALTEEAQLPHYAKKCFIFIAALLAAIPPLYDIAVELRTWGGYVETFVLTLFLLLSVLRLTRRWRAGASMRELAWRWTGIGLIVGLGLWVDPLIISAIIAAAIWILCSFVKQLRGSRRQTTLNPQHSPRSILKNLFPFVAVIPGCILGLTPAIIWGGAHGWENVTYMLRASSSITPEIQAHYPNRLTLFGGMIKVYSTCVGPRIISGAFPNEFTKHLTTFGPFTLIGLHIFTLVVGVACILTTVALVALSFSWNRPRLLQMRRLSALPLLFGACSIFIFCTATAAYFPGLCENDITGRYAILFMLALPFFFATTFTFLTMFIHERGKKQLQNADDRANNSQTQASARTAHSSFSKGIQVVLFVFLLFYLGAQVDTYRLSNSAHTFLSPYCLDAPTNLDPLIAYMEQEHIHYAWANNFIAYPIVFKTHGSILVDNPRPPFLHQQYLTRFPASVNIISHADRPSLIIFAFPWDSHPKLLRILDAEHVTYRARRFPSEPFIDLLAVTPLNRTVSPFESEVLNSLFICP